jgi:Tfp pilus assembly protein PilV
MIWPKRARLVRARRKGGRGEHGFTLIETVIALVIMMVVMLAAASLFAYSVYNNTAGSDRAQTLALAQQSLETLRSYKFAKTGTDSRLNAGTYTQTARYGGANRLYTIDWTIEDTTQTIKTITLSVTANGASRGPAARVSIVTQRARAE